MERVGVQPARSLPTGFPSLDRSLQTGGLPRARITEVFGPANCGKTALALQIVAHSQRNRASAAWIDAEHAFDPAFATALGVHLEDLPVAAPESAEDAMEITRHFVESDAVDLVVVDSAAALVPRLELETGVGILKLQTRVLGTALRHVVRSAARSDTSILFLNQARTRMDGSGETSAGGAPLKLHAAVRIALNKRAGGVHFRILKNKFGASFASGSLEWRPGAGFVDAHA